MAAPKHLMSGRVFKTIDGWFYHVKHGEREYGNKAGYARMPDATEAMTTILNILEDSAQKGADDAE